MAKSTALQNETVTPINDEVEWTIKILTSILVKSNLIMDFLVISNRRFVLESCRMPSSIGETARQTLLFWPVLLTHGRICSFAFAALWHGGRRFFEVSRKENHNF